MEHKVPYKDGEQTFTTNVPCLVIENQIIKPGNPDEIIAGAMKQPVGNPQSFSEFVKSSEKIIFVLCDGTRPTPTARILEHMFNEIRDHPDIGFLIATGAHREPTAEEFEHIFGPLYEEFRDRIAVHNARDKSVLRSVGTTSRGTPVSFNKAILEADGIVTINSVEPHYFAGFTGGRKSFLPGVAGYESIEHNHSHVTEPGALPLALDGNPVSEDMFEASRFLSEKRIFSVQTVVLPDGKLHTAFAGSMNEAFRLAVESATEVYSVEIPSRANIVVAVAQPPMDQDLYQSQKALEHGRIALESGGIMILVSSCWDGIGDMGFYRLLSDIRNDSEISNYLGKKYRLGNHKAARWLSLCADASLWGVTGLGDDVLKTVRMRGFTTLQQAVDEAVKITVAKGKEPRINLIPGGSFTVPKVIE
jgi:nickel-dependent lactate racemase